jgi:hypothetical protein
MVRGVGLVALAGSAFACGRLAFDPLVPATGVDAAGGDALDLPTGPFGSPTPLTTINDTSVDVDPSMTADGLLLFFCSTRPGLGNLNVWSSERATTADPWGTPVMVGAGEISTTATEQDPVISGDGLTLYFTRQNDIYRATRTSRADAFGAPVAISELNTGSVDVVSSVSYDGLTLTLHSTRPGSQGADIYLATRPDPSSAWTVVAMPGAVNGSNDESDSFMWNDRLTLYFDSGRASTVDFDIYVATRASASEPFGAPAPLLELDTADEEADLWLSADGRTALFVRGPDLLTLDIYEVHR